MTHSEKTCTKANVGKGGIAERASNSKLGWREHLQGVQAEIYFKNCRTIPDFRYLDFQDYMATEEKENCTLKRCQSAWFESIRKLSTSQHAGLKQKGESFLREWKCKLHSDAEALFKEKLLRKKKTLSASVSNSACQRTKLATCVCEMKSTGTFHDFFRQVTIFRVLW